jgi:hypothetical protein
MPTLIPKRFNRGWLGRPIYIPVLPAETPVPRIAWLTVPVHRQHVGKKKKSAQVALFLGSRARIRTWNLRVTPYLWYGTGAPCRVRYGTV